MLTSLSADDYCFISTFENQSTGQLYNKINEKKDTTAGGWLSVYVNSRPECILQSSWSHVDGGLLFLFKQQQQKHVKIVPAWDHRKDLLLSTVVLLQSHDTDNQYMTKSELRVSEIYVHVKVGTHAITCAHIFQATTLMSFNCSKIRYRRYK